MEKYTEADFLPQSNQSKQPQIFREDDFLTGSQESGFNMLIDAANTAKQMISGTLPSTANPDIRQMSGILQSSPPMRSLDAIAGAGRFVNRAVQGAAGESAEFMGRLGVSPKAAAAISTVPAAISEAMTPQDRIGALMSIAGIGQGQAASEAQAAAKASMLERAAGKTPVLKAGPLQKVAAGALGIETAIQPKYAQAIIADPSIVSESTLGRQEVQKLYDAYFKSKNMNFDPDTYKAVFGTRFVPSETQSGALRDVVETTLEKLEAKEPVTPEELVLAKTAAGNLMDTQAALKTPKLARQYAMAREQLSDALAASGDTRLQELDRMYFRANAKAAGQSVLPQNKNMSPNALRGYLMLRMAADAITQIGESPVKAAFSGVQAAAMSPYLATQMTSGISGKASPLSQALMMNIGGNRINPNGP